MKKYTQLYKQYLNESIDKCLKCNDNDLNDICSENCSIKIKNLLFLKRFIDKEYENNKLNCYDKDINSLVKFWSKNN